MRRRTFLAAGAATAAGAAKHAWAQDHRVLRFVPQADLTLLDPLQTTAYVTRNHAALVFDTLYGVDATSKPQLQMLQSGEATDGNRRWTLTLRDGLRFHDGTPVLARDVKASLERWGRRDSFGTTLFAAVQEVAVSSDRVVTVQLSRPFSALPDALGKPGPYLPVIMPERLARTEPTAPVPEMVGSGPFRFVAEERLVGARAVYDRFAGYQPRPDGMTSLLAGPKVAYLDRIEWITIPDASTAAAALQAGEVDWWEQPPVDLLPLLRRNSSLNVEVLDTLGNFAVIRPNHLHPPFDNPRIRRAVMRAVDQADFMTAVSGDDRALWQDGVGFFPPGTPMASDTGLEAVRSPSIEQAKQDLKAAGYRGEPVVLLAATDYPVINALSEVAGDLFRKLGLNVDYQALDWGTVLQRILSRQPPDRGGWSAMCSFTAGATILNPATHSFLRGNGGDAIFGWPNSPSIETLRQAWLDASDIAAQRQICRDIQAQAFVDLPYLPLGQFKQATAFRKDLNGISGGFPTFWNVKHT